ncbi:MAG: hypothetical protein A2W17_00855 [Planctomycetes bacterium RBG_16_41_13]|nr:MAG: hypothetical protein A2W17_00855 [Planctomycetes bacterium RBG_16_41_13]
MNCLYRLTNAVIIRVFQKTKVLRKMLNAQCSILKLLLICLYSFTLNIEYGTNSRKIIINVKGTNNG